MQEQQRRWQCSLWRIIYKSSHCCRVMKQNKRLFFEAVAPPFLAALLILATTDPANTTYDDIISNFWPVVLYTYFLGTFPSLIYALMMEIWFQLGLRTRCGLIGTVGFSGLLGAGATWTSTTFGMWLGTINEPVSSRMELIGIIVGLIIGFCVGRKPASAATQA